MSSKPKAKTESAADAGETKLIGYEITIEGQYMSRNRGGSGSGGIEIKDYSVTALMPPNWNDGNKGMTNVVKLLHGTLTGTPYLRSYTDAKGNKPYSDYYRIRTHHIVEWKDITDAARAGEVVGQQAPKDMTADQLINELTLLGVEFPNPARKSELAKLLEKARGKIEANPDADRPTFEGEAPAAAAQDPEDADKIVPGQAYEATKVGADGLPPETGKSITSSFK